MIKIRTHNSYSRSAALQGIKLEMKEIRRTYEEVTDTQKENMIKLHNEAIARKVAEKTKKRS